MTLRCVAACALLLFGTAAAAQTVYRCGADGNSYSQQPCPEGRRIEASDPRSRDQQAQTAAAARRDARTAEAMEKERLRSEAEPAAGPASLSAAKPPETAASTPAATTKKTKQRKREQPGASDDFRAVEPVKQKPAGAR